MTTTPQQLSAPTPVSTLTVLLPWTQFTQASKSILFCLVNLDAANPVTLFMDTTEYVDGGGTGYPDPDKGLSQLVAPLTQASFEVGPTALRTYFRLTAQTNGPGFPTVQVRWCARWVLETTMTEPRRWWGTFNPG